MSLCIYYKYTELISMWNALLMIIAMGFRPTTIKSGIRSNLAEIYSLEIQIASFIRHSLSYFHIQACVQSCLSEMAYVKKTALIVFWVEHMAEFGCSLVFTLNDKSVWAAVSEYFVNFNPFLTIKMGRVLETSNIQQNGIYQEVVVCIMHYMLNRISCTYMNTI